MAELDNVEALRVQGVSVIICALGQHGDMARALGSVLAQDAPDVPREIIVVAGADLSIRIPEHVRLVRPSCDIPGAIRQAGLDAARGAWVAWCDGDTAWPPGHLAALYARRLLEPDIALIYASADPQPFSFERLVAGNFIHASDTLARVGVARAVGGFDTLLTAGEEWDLWLRVAECHAVVHLPRPLAGQAAAPRHYPTRIVEHARFRARMRDVRAKHLANRRNMLDAFAPATWSAERRELLLQAPLEEDVSFGLVARELIRGLERRGVEVTLGPLRFKPVEGWERYYSARRATHDCLGMYYDYRVGPAVLRSEHVVRYTMWESTGVPSEQIDECNQTCALVYVPCRQNLDAYLERGLRVPIKVLSHGVDAVRFPLLARPRAGAEPFTFGAIGAFSPRKGMDVLIRAFEDEFAPREPARLLLKATHPDHGLRPRDPRVTIIEGFRDHAALLELLREMDAFVLPSRGEGFGLPGLEAMATGLPVIATNWSGPADYLDPADSLPLDYELANPGGARVHHSRFWGAWAEPSYEHLRLLLRWLYEHPAEAATLGRRAAARVQRDWTWERPAEQLYVDLDALARGITPA